MNWDVTIGIPVYNGEDRLDITLASLVKNHSGVKEIFISDNASTDRTPEIAQKYADKYDNIHYIRQPKKIPVGDNWAATLKPATGKYFMFIGHHDLISENYFSELVPLLEDDPEAVVAMPSVRAFVNQIGDLPTPQQQRPFYFDPLKSQIISNNLHDRVYAVLKSISPTATCTNQLTLTYMLRKVWFSGLRKKPYIGFDAILAMYLALNGKWKASDKAFYHYYLSHYYSKSQGIDQIVKRYSDNIQSNDISSVNMQGYIPRLYWQLCQKYATHIADDLLKMDIKLATLSDGNTLNATYEDQDWIESRVTMSPPQVSVPGLSRAYCAISTALREEENCRFYRNHYKGQFSEFRRIAEQRAQQFYLRMWEILLNEDYIAPQYKLNAQETEMFNKLMRYKNERSQWEQKILATKKK